MDEKELKRALEGILFAMGDSVETERMAKALEVEESVIEGVLTKLAAEYEKQKRGYRIVRLENAWQMCSSSDIYEYLIKIAKQPRKHVLTDVLLETLSIIAYKQPITKSEVEKIRCVSCDHAVNKLVEYNLVAELGRLDAPGRPMLFGTTEEFLRSFGINSLADLPTMNPVQVEEFKLQAEEEVERALAESVD